MAAEPGSVRVQCTSCDAAEVIDDKLLGTKVKCKSCETEFDADWGEPVAVLPPPNESESDEPESSGEEPESGAAADTVIGDQ